MYKGVPVGDQRDESYSPGDLVLLCDRTEGWVEGRVVEQRADRLCVFWVLPYLKARCIGWLRAGEVLRLEEGRRAG